MIIHYITENEMLYKLRAFCVGLQRENTQMYHIVNAEQEGKSIYKFNKAKGKRILQNKYIKAKCGSNHCYLEEDFDLFCKDYIANAN